MIFKAVNAGTANKHWFEGVSGGGIDYYIVNTASAQTMSAKILTDPQVNGSSGIFPTTATSGTISCGKSGNLWSSVWSSNGSIQTSDGNLKTNKIPLNKVKIRNFVNALNPVSYNWLNSTDTTTYLGLIAQEVEEARINAGLDDDAIIETYNDADGVLRYSMRYTELFGPLISYAQSTVDNLIPNEDAVSDIGSSSKRYENLYISGSVINTSDARHKENVESISSDIGMTFINRLVPKKYNMIGKPSELRVGLIAQDVQKVCEELDIKGIVKESVGQFGLAYSELTPYLISAIHSLNEKNKKLESRLERLETMFTEAAPYLKETNRLNTKIRSIQSPRKTTS
jgi:hypothetical protein